MSYEMVVADTFYHGTGPTFEKLDDKLVFHVGSRQQALARSLGRVVVAECCNMKAVRRKDCGGASWPRKVRALRGKGIDAIVYLNRYEGVPLERTLRLMAEGKGRDYLDRLSDEAFKKLVPEAHDSYLIMNLRCVRKITIETVKNGNFDNGTSKLG